MACSPRETQYAKIVRGTRGKIGLLRAFAGILRVSVSFTLVRRAGINRGRVYLVLQYRGIRMH